MSKQRYVARCPIDSIKPHPLNPNRGDVEFIAHSIEINGFYGAVQVQESTKFIIAGEHRWRAAQLQGLKTVPVIFDECGDAEALRKLLVDNESARRAALDAAAKEVALANLAEMEGGLDGSGFDLDDLKEFEVEREKADTEPEYPEFEDSYGIIIVCESEADQKAKFDTLVDMGFEDLRVIAV